MRYDPTQRVPSNQSLENRNLYENIIDALSGQYGFGVLALGKSGLVDDLENRLESIEDPLAIVGDDFVGGLGDKAGFSVMIRSWLVSLSTVRSDGGGDLRLSVSILFIFYMITIP